MSLRIDKNFLKTLNKQIKKLRESEVRNLQFAYLTRFFIHELFFKW